ncbi:MAG: tRNA (guanosine(46)-N7)-methyltransferase TrmB, partial [Cyclonatronaceae bacterium]
DSAGLFNFTLETLGEEGPKASIRERIDDVYALEPPPELLRIKTYYERQHLKKGRIIKYLCFTL